MFMYHVIEFLAAAKHIRAELMTIKTLLREDKRVEFCCIICEFNDDPGLRVGVSSPPDEDESSSQLPSILSS